MKKICVIYWIGLFLLTFFISCDCEFCADPSAHEITDLYLMEKDYSEYVYVKVISPNEVAPADYRNYYIYPNYDSMDYNKPIKLIDGYYTGGNCGIYTGYVDLKWEDYNDTVDVCKKRILTTAPYKEYYVVRNPRIKRTFTKEELTKIISKGHINRYFRLIYRKS